jgi:hypothetical protein
VRSRGLVERDRVGTLQDSIEIVSIVCRIRVYMK